MAMNGDELPTSTTGEIKFAVAYDVHSPYVHMEILELGNKELTVSKGTVVFA
jgi:hypothetical protein